MNFSEHRLTDWTWQELYRAQLGENTYNDYFTSVWMALDRLQENEYYDIAKQVKTENRDLFIKICCQYVLTHKEYEFSSDYTKIIRRECFILTENREVVLVKYKTAKQIDKVGIASYHNPFGIIGGFVIQGSCPRYITHWRKI